MKVVVDGVIFEHRPRGGVARIYRETLPRICDQEPAANVVLFSEGRVDDDELPHHPRIVHRSLPHVRGILRPHRLWNPAIPAVQAAFRRLLLGGGKDAIWHSTYYSLPYAWRGRQVTTVYDLVHERFADDLFVTPADDIFRRHKRRCIEAADAIICISATTRSDLLDYFTVDPARVFVVYPGFSEVFSTPDETPARDTERSYLLYVGDRRAHKAFTLVARAFAQGHGGKLSLRLVGGGPLTADEQALIVDLGIGSRITTHAAVSDRELRTHYAGALALIYPSVYEGFGLPIVEAMACGCPVLASRIPSSVEVGGDCISYFEPSSVEDLIEAIARLREGDTGTTSTRRAMERAQRYSWDRAAQETLGVYRQLIETH